MVETDTVAADVVAASDVIDDMEASTDVFGATDLKFLAAYQVALAAGRTKQSDDWRFVTCFIRYWMRKMGHN